MNNLLRRRERQYVFADKHVICPAKIQWHIEYRWKYRLLEVLEKVFRLVKYQYLVIHTRFISQSLIDRIKMVDILKTNSLEI